MDQPNDLAPLALITPIALALAGLAACGGSPLRSEPPPPPPSEPIRGGLGAACDESTACAGGLTCRLTCGDGMGEYVPDQCEPASVAFCDTSDEKERVTLEEMMLVLEAGTLHGVLGVVDREVDVLSEGELRVFSVTDDAVVAGRGAPEELVPVPLRSLIGRQFDVIGDDGQACAAEAVAFAVVALEPRELALEGEHGEDAFEVGQEIDVEMLHYARQNGAVYLTLTLHSETSCSGAIWARATDLPAVPYGPGRGVRGMARQSALSAFGGLVPFRVESERYRTTMESDAEWTRFREGGGFGPEVFRFDVNEHPHIVVAAQAGDICHGYEGALMTTFAAQGGALRLGAVSWRTAFRPRLALDLDEDGELELIEHDGTRARFWSPTLETTSEFATAEATTGC